MATTDVKTLRFPNPTLMQEFLQNQRTAAWRSVAKHSDGITVVIAGISIHQVAKAIDGYDAIKIC